MEKEGQTENKVVLIGEASVGKTCIIVQFMEGRFSQYISSTISAEFCRKKYEFPGNQSITLDIWDTAGQEKFRSLNRIFYSKAKAVILVYDITNKSTFEEIKNYWYGQIIDNCYKGVIIAVAANKSDLFEDREVSNEEGEEFANSINAIFSSTSAKNNSGITNLFETIAMKLSDPDFFLESDSINLNKKKKKKTCC